MRSPREPGDGGVANTVCTCATCPATEMADVTDQDHPSSHGVLAGPDHVAQTCDRREECESELFVHAKGQLHLL